MQGFLQCFHVLLLVKYLLHCLGQMCLQLVLCICCLAHPLLEGHVGVLPLAPQLISTSCDQVVHLAHQAGASRPGSLVSFSLDLSTLFYYLGNPECFCY